MDARARRILFDAYWGPKGWKEPREEPSAADLAHAIAAGYMFKPEMLKHDAALQRMDRAKGLVSLDEVAAGFVASLASRAVHLRPALGSYFVLQSMPMHPFSGTSHCIACGQFRRWEHDFSPANFARLKWGLFPRFFAVDHAFTLERFAHEPRPEATAQDRELLHRILALADNMPADAGARDLEAALKPLIRSNKAEREILVEILFACDVLAPSRTTPEDVRRIPLKTNWTDEPALWRGDDGVNREQAARLFGWG